MLSYNLKGMKIDGRMDGWIDSLMWMDFTYRGIGCLPSKYCIVWRILCVWQQHWPTNQWPLLMSYPQSNQEIFPYNNIATNNNEWMNDNPIGSIDSYLPWVLSFNQLTNLLKSRACNWVSPLIARWTDWPSRENSKKAGLLGLTCKNPAVSTPLL